MINSLITLPKIRSNFLKRVLTGLVLIMYMIAAIYYGAPFILINILLIQLKCFSEIIQIAYKIKNNANNSNFRKINWYLVFTANYFLTGDTLGKHMKIYHSKYYFLSILNHYHKFISFCLYFFGLICFLISVKKKQMRQQFELLFWTHFLIIIIVWQSYMAVYNLFEGIIWVMLPLGLVILNDVFSYTGGKLFGKTPLISLSPKKTCEGFIFGGLCTILLGPILAYLFSRLNYLTCPINYKESNGDIILITNCTPSYVFQLQEYRYGDWGFSISTSPLILHTLALSIFASIIAPFGGFFASGFKRAARIKDFGDLIPGHGGLMDRFDCQFLMATFSRVYIKTFIKSPSVENVLRRVLSLSDERQLEFFYLFEKALKSVQYEE